ncbi:LOW QUALITY PROTEIN: aminoacylase-1-like [Leguminivora glycinivorella]|uniref:LOW QUALITY PROTEIN: aminoacylase-1-like n=1 Tax=Leguminivora glycinivorella TaxID=1035111 RepID=UPI00200C4438|nr:LOW QUALITY PROTEIN: aminoacylase-1-like [Leguminivora glycinivorella]
MSTVEIDYSKHAAVINLQNYLRVKCVHPDVNYDDTINFLTAQATAMGLPQKHVLSPNNPVLLITWEGLQPELPSILLNSHMDTVPVEGTWKHAPFAAEIEDGNIYGRGTQDMKSASIQHLEAVRALIAKGKRLKRTVHLSFVPDEEKGGERGMREFVKTEAFRSLNVGFALDEGLANAGEEYLVFSGEKTKWQMKIVCTGKAGHGSMFLPDNSGEKVRHIINRFMELRDKYRQQLVDDASLTIGDVTTINLTKLEGGVLTNIVPEKFTATFDIRLATTVNHELFENMINRWCKEAGSGVTIEFESKDPYTPPTRMDNSNAYWVAMKGSIENMGISITQRTLPATSDARFLRSHCPVLNFTPMRRVPPMPHQTDERLPLQVFVEGIQVYENILQAVGNVQ